jgi:hypothetical protein
MAAFAFFVIVFIRDFVDTFRNRRSRDFLTSFITDLMLGN